MRKSSTAKGALALSMALTIVQQTRATAAPADIFQTSAPVVGSDPPKAAEIHDGDASVSSQTGQLSYGYPITVPPGRRGMQPHLALSYSSQAPIYGGVAAGWSLSIPIITEDTSTGRLWFPSGFKVYKSSLAGERQLVPTPETVPSGVAATYRAQNDSSFQRYQRMVPSTGYSWRVLTSDGLVYYFGDLDHTSRCEIISDEYAPLTRMSDAFGNLVEYFYEPGVSGECRITSITWGQNKKDGVQNVADFARVSFKYATAPLACNSADPKATPSQAVGSQVSFRTGRPIVTGASELDSMTIIAYPPGQAVSPVHTRTITLGYDSAEASCAAKHAPFRSLISIQEKAWGIDSPLVSLPAVNFTYGSSSLAASYPTETLTPKLPWPANAAGEVNNHLYYSLSWGYRPVSGPWPTVEAMLVDLDGDGLLDRLTSVPVTQVIDGKIQVVSCGAQWQRNRGNLAFAAPVSIPLPTLKWATKLGGTAYQGGAYANANTNMAGLETCSLNYQLTGYVNGSPTGGNSTSCGNQNQDGAGGCAAGRCSNGADCTFKAPNPKTYSTLAYRWLDINGDGLIDLIASPAQGGYALYDLQWGRGFTPAGTVPREPATFGTFPSCPSPTFTQDATGRYTMCGGMYPWFIYLNHGDATFGHRVRRGPASDGPGPRPEPRMLPDSIKYQPVPLESTTGDSSIVSKVVSQNQGMVDVDGDGFPDAIAGAEAAWSVFRNDGTGQLRPASGSAPYSWTAAPGDTLAQTACPPVTEACNPIGMAGLFDVNGDGLVDQWDRLGLGPYANLEYSDGTKFRVAGSGGELTLALRPATDATTVVLTGGVVGSGSPHGGTYWITAGTRRDTARTLDMDHDGRPDVVQVSGSAMVTSFNEGNQFAGGAALGDQTALPHWIVASTATGPATWEVRSDMVDLDGDGIPEGVYMGTGPSSSQFFLSRITTPTKPPRLLVKIDNQRGAVTNVSYASMTSATVIQDPANGKYMPRTGWVVSSLSTFDSIANTTTTSAFKYSNPRFLPDDRGMYGFRGFELVETTLPSGAIKADHYDYTPDWSGRLSQTAMRPSEAPAEARTIDRTTWTAKGLFCDASNLNCAITTYHATSTEHLVCFNGTIEAQCSPESAAGYTHTITTLSACNSTMAGGTCDVTTAQTPGSLLWLETRRSLLQSATAAADGDRRTSTNYAVWSDGTTYRVRPLTSTKEVQQSNAFTVYGRTGNDWNQDPGLQYSLPITDLVWFDNTSAACTASTPTCAVTRRSYDIVTGNVIDRTKPVQNSANGPPEKFDYDTRKLFVIAEHSEPGGYYNLSQERDFVYEYGTGTKLETKGPNIASCAGPPPYNAPTCPNGTTYLQDSRIKVDGLGRTLELWETHAGAGHSSYRNFNLEIDTYVDTMPAAVTTQSAIDFDGSFSVRYAKSKVDLDGHGRTVKKTVYALGAAAADQITSVVFRNDGTLGAVDLPDPTANTTSTVRYSYTFDSLGRPTAVRRPDTVSLPNQSGVDLSYNGLARTTAEVVGTALGKPASTTITKDAFGRLKYVDEKTSSTTGARTTYAYDAADNVVSIVDPAGVTTTMVHDFAGRRTQINRAVATWKYTYDKNGNLTSETFPGSTAPIQPDPNFVNTFTYDNLDYMLGKSIGQRTLSAPDAEALGALYERYFWELGANNEGQIAAIEDYGLSGAIVTRNQYLHDLQGREVHTYETFAGLPSYRQIMRSFVLNGGTGATYYYDYPAAERATWSNVVYDNRGLPRELQLSLSATTPTSIVGVQTRNVAGLVTARRSDVADSPMTFVESKWSYDKLSRVTNQVVQQGPGPTQTARQRLAYFGNDDVKTLDQWLGASNHKHFTYEFDWRHQLTTVGESLLPNAFTAAYAYGTAGRFSSARETVASLPNSDVRPRNVTYQYNGTDPEEVTALVNVSNGKTAWAFAYDPAGNQTMRCSGPIVSGSCTGADETDYVYDGNDRLRRATRKRGGTPQGSEEYWYDGHGDRNIVVKRDSSGNKTETLWFIGEDEAHYDGSGNWVHTYVHVTMGTPVARVDTGSTLVGKIEYQFHGLASNTLAAVDQSTGIINATFDYAPFGEIIEATNGGGTGAGVTAHRRRMNDKFVDSISELSYYGLRYYDNTSMNWTQGDPLYRICRDIAGASPRRADLYEFSMNNPLRYMDPDGLDSFGADQFFNHMEKGSVAAVGAASEGGGWGPVVGPGETLSTARRLWGQMNTASGGALGMAAWAADRGWAQRRMATENDVVFSPVIPTGWYKNIKNNSWAGLPEVLYPDTPDDFASLQLIAGHVDEMARIQFDAETLQSESSGERRLPHKLEWNSFFVRDRLLGLGGPTLTALGLEHKRLRDEVLNEVASLKKPELRQLLSARIGVVFRPLSSARKLHHAESMAPFEPGHEDRLIRLLLRK